LTYLEINKPNQIEDEETHIEVQQMDEESGYEWTAFSAINLTFGFLDGALNAMPKGGHLSFCG
jgi:hypothetical protein